MNNLVYLYLLSPLHTGGATQEGNLLGIARESHTDFPYIPSSTIRGRLRASVEGEKRSQLFGTDLETSSELEQGAIWVGDGSILWLPVPSLSHGVVWISCPMLLRRWARFYGKALDIPAENSTNLAASSPVYLKDAIFKAGDLQTCENWKKFIPDHPEAKGISTILILSDSHCATLIQMSLWRQVKVKLDEHKSVSGGFRYEEAIPPDTLMYFPWGITAQARNRSDNAHSEFHGLMQTQNVLQIGGQESLGRGFVQNWQP